MIIIKLDYKTFEYKILDLTFSNIDEFYNWLDDRFYSKPVYDKCVVGDFIKIYSDDWGTEYPSEFSNIMANHLTNSKFDIRGDAYILKMNHKIENNLVIESWLEDFSDIEFDSIIKLLKQTKEKSFIPEKKLGYE